MSAADNAEARRSVRSWLQGLGLTEADTWTEEQVVALFDRDFGEDFGIKPQPDSVPNDSEPVWDMVVDDIKARDELGERKYGTRLQVGNGRDHLLDLYHELLDAVVYCRQELERRRLAENEEATLSDAKHEDLGHLCR